MWYFFIGLSIYCHNLSKSLNFWRHYLFNSVAWCASRNVYSKEIKNSLSLIKAHAIHQMNLVFDKKLIYHTNDNSVPWAKWFAILQSSFKTFFHFRNMWTHFRVQLCSDSKFNTAVAHHVRLRVCSSYFNSEVRAVKFLTCGYKFRFLFIYMLQDNMVLLLTVSKDQVFVYDDHGL